MAELTPNDIVWLRENHISDPCDDVDAETEAAFNEHIMEKQRAALTAAAELMVKYRERGDTWRNWCLALAAVILLRTIVLLGWLPPVLSILWGR